MKTYGVLLWIDFEETRYRLSLLKTVFDRCFWYIKHGRNLNRQFASGKSMNLKLHEEEVSDKQLEGVLINL